MITLNEKQKSVIDRIKAGEHTIMVGKAGTGKTEVIKALSRELATRGVPVLKTASTGIAAQHIGGVTIHSMLAILPEPFAAQSFKFDAYSYSQRMRKIVENIDQAVLVIDEISMIRADVMEAILEKIKALSELIDITVLISGDTAQLPPVQAGRVHPRMNAEETNRVRDLLGQFMEAYGEQDPHFYKARNISYFNFEIVELDSVYRQSDGGSIRTLDEIRKPSSLSSRKIISDWLSNPFRHLNVEAIPDTALVVCPVNEGAEAYNNLKLADLKGKTHEFECTMTEAQDRMLNFEKKLVLKVGAVVQVVVNLPNENLVNGQRGRVMAIDPKAGEVLVNFEGTGEVYLKRVEYGTPYYGYRNGKVVLLMEDKFKQFPLKLAWAVTVHKSQGMSADRVHILNRHPNNGRKFKFFANGQLYVACSRARDIRNLTLSSRVSEAEIKPGSTKWIEKFGSTK